MDIPLDQIICHDVAKGIPLPDECIDVVITSPPYYGLRDYGIKGQLGLEKHPQEYIDKLVEISREIKRVLKKTGSYYLNLGDTYCGSGCGTNDYRTEKSRSIQGIGKNKNLYKTGGITAKLKYDKGWLQPKQLMMIPARIAIALQDDGWILRNDVIWHKLNTMPSSVKDRLNVIHEHVFHFVKQQRYYYDLDAIREPHKASSLARAKYDFNLIPRAWKQEAIPISGGKNININCHPKGKNPGDTMQYNSKYQQISQEMASEGRIIDKVAFERKVLGVPHDLSTCHPSGKNPGDFWDITTQPFTGYSEDLEHFAVFPEEIVVRPLLASCPQMVCKKCGKPRQRLTKLGELVRNPTTHESHGYTGKRGSKLMSVGNDPLDSKAAHWKRDKFIPGLTRIHETVSWSDCGCNKGFDSGMVLDPFCGRGTVGKVAKQLGFHYIMIDIKPEYCELARLYIAGQKHKLQKGQKKLRTS